MRLIDLMKQAWEAERAKELEPVLGQLRQAIANMGKLDTDGWPIKALDAIAVIEGRANGDLAEACDAIGHFVLAQVESLNVARPAHIELVKIHDVHDIFNGRSGIRHAVGTWVGRDLAGVIYRQDGSMEIPAGATLPGSQQAEDARSWMAGEGRELLHAQEELERQKDTAERELRSWSQRCAQLVRSYDQNAQGVGAKARTYWSKGTQWEEHDLLLSEPIIIDPRRGSPIRIERRASVRWEKGSLMLCGRDGVQLAKARKLDYSAEQTLINANPILANPLTMK